jgi:2',3'-cyclic-nucleotide 2'-phosphodiesterase (5'-nucleotidase family)
LPAPEVVGGVPIVHAGPYGRFVSCTELERDGERTRLKSGELLPLLRAAESR